MEELKTIEEQFQDLIQKRNLKDIKTCYANIEDISNLKNKLNQLNDPIIISKKDDLIDIYNQEIRMNINYIINLSFAYFMDNMDSEEDYASVLLDIQKSSFYPKYKSNYKIQTMEIYYLMEEINKNDDCLNVAKKLKEYSKNVFDLELKKEIKELIQYCEIKNINNEKNKIKKLLEKKEFEKAKIKYEQILQENKNELIKKNITQEYNFLLENLNKYQIK